MSGVYRGDLIEPSEYRRLSNKSTYTVQARCMNCDYKGQLHVERGTEKPNVSTCPKCGCYTLRS